MGIINSLTIYARFHVTPLLCFHIFYVSQRFFQVVLFLKFYPHEPLCSAIPFPSFLRSLMPVTPLLISQFYLFQLRKEVL